LKKQKNWELLSNFKLEVFMKTIMIVMVFLSVMILTACGNDPATFVNPDIVDSVTTVIDTSTLNSVLSQEDMYLESIGQHDLVPGLDCTLYTVSTSTTSITQANATSGAETNVASFSYTGAFNQPQASVTAGFNVLPTALQSLYQTYFIVKCQGYLIELDDQYHEFTLTSDDGSLLTLDTLLVNNDGLHSSQTVSATKQTTIGAHYLEVDFLQATGNQILVLSQDGVVMDGNLFYH
jgi:hypothetical protein